MEKCIPEGRYNLILVIPEKYLGVMEKSHIVKMYGVHEANTIIAKRINQLHSVGWI